ncbi:hypothetical protein Cni_G22209 [Canna indica]|uniref:C2H2-type domain-containing protein n=1 Tax=Canna indica TaxID=4628 RepID=A0AAQ3QJD2_9LILI|nr:hypothetical protein Cni_G22209 [Canna indica]
MSAAEGDSLPLANLGLAAPAGDDDGDDDDDDPSRRKSLSPVDDVALPFPKEEEGGDADDELSPPPADYVSPVLCGVCSKTFDSPKSLNGHMRSHPTRKWRGSLPPSMRPGIEDEVAESLLLLSNSGGSRHRKYTCDVCNQGFDTPQGLGGHLSRQKRRRSFCVKANETKIHSSRGGSSNPSKAEVLATIVEGTSTPTMELREFDLNESPADYSSEKEMADSGSPQSSVGDKSY